MKAIIGFLVGAAISYVLTTIVFPSEPVVKVQTQLVGRILPLDPPAGTRPCVPAPAKQDTQCLSPAYVLGLLRDCRNGKLDQAEADITLRQ